MPRKSTKKTEPKSKETPKKQQPDALPAPVPEVAPEAHRSAWTVIKEGLVWLIIWTCLFMCFDGCRSVIKNGLPSIHIEWRRNDAKSNLGRWILAERPPLLKSDYPAVGAELAETARRLRDGQLGTLNAAAADTIARVQPVVSDANTWRQFIFRLGGQIEGGSIERLAEQYDEAAGLFGHVKAVEALAEIGEDTNNEESDTEADPQNSDCGGALGDERQDQVESQPDGGGEDSGPLQSTQEEDGGTGTDAGAESQCPTGTCPTRTAPTTYRQNPWYGWPGLAW